MLIISVLLAYYFSFVTPKKTVAKKCQGFIPNWADFVDCYGVVTINDGWDMDYLSFKDHINKYEIARVYNQNQYIYTDNKIFVINRKPIENSSSNGNETIYYQKLFQSSQLIEKSYNAISDIPIYLVVDTISGEVQAYKNISDVPENKRAYFIELESK